MAYSPTKASASSSQPFQGKDETADQAQKREAEMYASLMGWTASPTEVVGGERNRLVGLKLAPFDKCSYQCTGTDASYLQHYDGASEHCTQSHVWTTMNRRAYFPYCAPDECKAVHMISACNCGIIHLKLERISKFSLLYMYP